TIIGLQTELAAANAATTEQKTVAGSATEALKIAQQTAAAQTEAADKLRTGLLDTTAKLTQQVVAYDRQQNEVDVLRNRVRFLTAELQDAKRVAQAPTGPDTRPSERVGRITGGTGAGLAANRVVGTPAGSGREVPNVEG